jgi:hypothetical protein
MKIIPGGRIVSNRAMTFPIVSAGICLAIALVATAASACPYSIRDVGFVDLEPSRYRLYYLISDDTPRRDATANTFKELADTMLLDSNIQAEVVNVSNQKTHPILDTVRFTELKTFPAALLTSPGGRSLVLSAPDTGKDSDAPVASLLDAVLSSPRRDEILEHIVTAWCVVLLIEGTDVVENTKARETVTDAIETVAGSTTQMGLTINKPPHLILLSPHSFAEEKVLLWSLGLEQHDATVPRVAVLYGRGRQIGPIFQGEDLTRNPLLGIFHIIGADCGCQTDRRILAGTVIPLRWGKEKQREVVKHVGFDAESPMVKTEISRIWSSGSTVALYGDGPLGYTEGAFRQTAEPTYAVSEQALSPDTRLQDSARRTVLLTGCGAALLVFIGSGITVIGTRRKKRERTVPEQET